MSRLITNVTSALPGDYAKQTSFITNKTANLPAASNGRREDYQKQILIVVDGTPISKPRMTQRDRWAKRPCVLRYRDWCDKVRSIAGTLPDASLVAEVNWTAYFEPPASWAKSRRLAAYDTPHRAKPDLDNVAKGIMDCLWPESDSGIHTMTAAKRWSMGARIEIEIVLN